MTIPEITPALCSAIAAAFSALSSFLIMRIQRRNLLESVRPELILRGFSRRSEGTGEGAHDIIDIQTIKNIGRGNAFKIFFNASHRIDNQQIVSSNAIIIPVLGIDEENTLNSIIRLQWKNVKADNTNFKYIRFPIIIVCFDSRGMRHEIHYKLTIAELSPPTAVLDEVAPGVVLDNRINVPRSVLWLKFLYSCRRIRYNIRRMRYWIANKIT